MEFWTPNEGTPSGYLRRRTETSEVAVDTDLLYEVRQRVVKKILLQVQNRNELTILKHNSDAQYSSRDGI